MKILKLRIHNLASFAGTQTEIDFSQEPLASAGLIAITGRTGAGKSTLLDAICLTLFNQMPRLKSVSGKIQDPNGELLDINKTTHILRRGCVQGYAELDFIGLDQQQYTARWAVSRAHKKINGKIKLEQSLIQIDNQKLITNKPTEYKNHIKKLIGMSFDQFTRAVLLAQSEVVAFLKANDDERAHVLEYLTNSEIFAWVGKTAYEKAKYYENELKQIKQSLGFIEILTAEQIDTLTQQKNLLQQQLDVIFQQQEQIKLQQNWYKQWHDLNQQHDAIQEKRQQHQQQASLYQKKQHRLDQLIQFETVKYTLQQLTEIDQQLQQTRTQFTQEQHKATQLQQQTLELEPIFKTHLKQYQHMQAQQQQLQPIFEQVLALDIKIEPLRDEYKRLKQQQKNTQQHIEHLITQQQSLHTQLQQQQNQAQTVQNTLVQYRDFQILTDEPKSSLTQIKQLQQDYQAYQKLCKMYPQFNAKQDFEQQITQEMNLFFNTIVDFNIDTSVPYTVLFNTAQDFIYQQREKIQNNLKQAEHITQQNDAILQGLLTYQQYFEQNQKNQTQLQQLQQQYQKQHIQQNVAEQTLQACQTQFKQLQQQLEQQKILTHDYVIQLRQQLKSGEPCHICGSREHPYIQHAHLLQDALQHIEQQQLNLKQNEVNELQKRYDDAKYQYAVIETQLNQHTKTMQTQYEQWQIQLADLKKQHILTEQHDLLFDADQYVHFQNTLRDYQTQLQQSEKQKDFFTAQLSTLEQQQKQLHDLKTQFEQYHHIAQAKQHYLQQWQNLIQNIPTEIQTAWQQHDIIQHCQNLIEIIETVQLQKQFALQCEKEINDIQQQLKPLDYDIQHFQQQLTQQTQQLNQVKQQGQDYRQQLSQLMQQFPLSSEVQTGKAWKTQIEQQFQSIESTYLIYEKQLQQIQQQQNQQQNQQALLEKQIEVYQQQYQRQFDLKQAWLKKHTDFDDTLLTYYQQQTEWNKADLTTELEHYHTQGQQFIAQSDTLKQQLAQHQQQKPASNVDFAEMPEQLSQLQQQQNQLQHEISQLDAQFLQQQHALAKQAQQENLITELGQQHERWYKISSTIGHSSDGKKFRQYAQQHYLDILIEYANQQLEPLASRYQLERIEHSLGLAVIDHDMNGEKRAVASLSGGESFIVALALALALANLASGTLKIESLFIDEGFGTLDPDSLHIVMDALDKLQYQGRKVILISHIQEMHERIPVQIQVNRIGAGQSKLEIVG